jgi:hypothetical protein
METTSDKMIVLLSLGLILVMAILTFSIDNVFIQGNMYITDNDSMILTKNKTTNVSSLAPFNDLSYL